MGSLLVVAMCPVVVEQGGCRGILAEENLDSWRTREFLEGAEGVRMVSPFTLSRRSIGILDHSSLSSVPVTDKVLDVKIEVG